MTAKTRCGPQGEVVGLDAARGMLDRASTKAVKASVDLTLEHGLMEDIPLDDNSFDVVLSSVMIHHLPSEEVIRRGLSQVFRVLKPGGRLLVLDKQSLNRRLPPMLEEAGFIDIELGRRYRVLSYVLGQATKAEA